MTEQAVLHEASELGQSRVESLSELAVVACRTSLRAFGTALLWGSVVTGGRLFCGDDVAWWQMLLTYGAVWALRFGLSIEDDLDLHQEGLRSEKIAKSYVTPEPRTDSSPWRAPIPVTAGKRTGLIDINPDPVARLPGPLPKAQRLELSPELVTEILAVILEQGKDWSRQAVMSVRWKERTVPKRLYSELTRDLYQSGILVDRPKGGYRLTTQDPDELTKILPGLAVRLGRTGGRPGTGEDPDGRPLGGGVAGTLAERHRLARYNELDHSVKLYLEGRR